MRSVHGESSYELVTPEVSLSVSARGGHMAPVVFHLPGRDVAPYSLSPWQPEEYLELPPLLSVLRGDFLCLPFGGQADGPPHGETANAHWSLLEADVRTLRLAIETTDTGARVEKILSIRDGQTAVFIENRIENLEGDFSYGNHPILDFSHIPEGAGRVSTSPFHWASTFPGAFSDPAAGEFQALAEGAEFRDLQQVSLAAGGTTDITRYPLRPGNDDLVMLAASPATDAQPFAWSAAVMDGYVWFSLKNAADFPCTILWISNAGRTAAPWLGRHCGRLGIEEVCSYFSNGIDLSRQNLLAAQGVPTTRHFSHGETVSLRTIHAVATVPKTFGLVQQIVPHDAGSIEILGESGESVIVPLDWKFVL